ncbi:putative nuclease HARBI1 [Tanacetum coccineum]
MSRTLFTRIIRELTDNSPYFQQGIDCTRKVGITPLMNCISAIRQSEYDIVPEALDENLQMVEKTSRDSLNIFVREKHVFSGMLRSINYMDWSWANCLTAYRAQYCRGDHGSDTFILLEAVASQDLWIWHAFFGVFGANNDVNVIRQLPIFKDHKDGKALKAPFVANDSCSNVTKRISYKNGHEATRKDVE